MLKLSSKIFETDNISDRFPEYYNNEIKYFSFDNKKDFIYETEQPLISNNKKIARWRSSRVHIYLNDLILINSKWTLHPRNSGLVGYPCYRGSFSTIGGKNWIAVGTNIRGERDVEEGVEWKGEGGERYPFQYLWRKNIIFAISLWTFYIHIYKYI